MYPSRPRVRGDCFRVPRPCPFVSCRHHLYLEVRRRTVRLNHPDREPQELEESCALDVADRGGSTLQTVAEALNLSRERVRQLEEGALPKLAGRLSERGKSFADSSFARRAASYRASATKKLFISKL